MKTENSIPCRVLDTYALLAFLLGETGEDKVWDLLLSANHGSLQLAMCVINLGELYYMISRKKTPAFAEGFMEEIFTMPVDIVSADWEVTHVASQFKAKTAISYADCFAAALAFRLDCPIVTGDPEFHRLENQVTVEWL